MDRSSKQNDKSKFQIEEPPTLLEGQTQGVGDITQAQQIVEEVRKPKFQLTIPDMAIFDTAPKPLIEEAPVVYEEAIGDQGFLSQYAKAHAEPYAKTFGELKSDVKQAWTSTGQFVQGVSNLLVGDWLGNPERIHEAFASGSKDKILQALDGMAYDLTFQLADLAMGKTALISKTALQNYRAAVAGQNAINPRQIAKQVNQIVPGALSSKVHSMWEVLTSPVARGADAVLHKRFLPSTEGSKSIAEVFQPAVERLESTGLDVPFRRTSALKAVASEKGKELGQKLANMPLRSRYEVYKYLRGLPANAPEKKLMEDWKHSFATGNMEREFVHSFRKTLKSKMKDEFLLGEEQFFRLPAAENFIRTLDQSLSGPFDAKKVQKALKGAIQDVNTPNELKFLARDLYNLPHSTPMAVANASKDASVTFLTNNLKRMGVVQDTLPQGAKLGDDWWISKFPHLKDSYVPR
ncbi:hypothetical protein, partial [Candidatus Magnetobacterium casense]